MALPANADHGFIEDRVLAQSTQGCNYHSMFPYIYYPLILRTPC